jgi:hypothetical protein
MPLSPSELPHQLLGLPWQFLVLGLALCLIFSALGFRRVEYFVSLGYAASIAAQAVAFPFLYRDTIRGLALLQAGLLLAYGLRLGIFLTLRDAFPRSRNSRRKARNAASMLGARSRLQSGSEYRSFTFSFSCRHCSRCQRRQAEWRWHRPPWGFC